MEYLDDLFVDLFEYLNTLDIFLLFSTAERYQKLVKPKKDYGTVHDQFIEHCKKGKILQVSLALSGGIIDPTYEFQQSLRSAVLHDQIEIVKLLLACESIDPNYGHFHESDPRIDPYYDDDSAIKHAVRNANYNMVKLLLSDKRVDPEIIGAQLLSEAADDAELLKILLEDGRCSWIDDDYIEDPFETAVDCGNCETAKLLMDYGHYHPDCSRELSSNCSCG